ncbi:MAG: hypothetical protein EOO83_02650 [Oxalobacteraceae bacterium]|nr:MAG: hypothetical protein EOO83_02650 [Oxalobacteraceae bacterium]
MTDAQSYWSPLLSMVPLLRCWARTGWRTHDSGMDDGEWGQMLIMPTGGYLEAGDGPIRVPDVRWVELSTEIVKGGLAGIPLQFVDREGDILAGLSGADLNWECRETVWSLPRIFDARPVKVLRFANPFYDETTN